MPMRASGLMNVCVAVAVQVACLMTPVPASAAKPLEISAPTARGTAAGLQYQLEPWGTDAIRVRVAAPGTQLSQPIIAALQSTSPPPSRTTDAVVSASPSKVTNGNIAAEIDTATGFVTVTRVSDGAVLLAQSAMNWTKVGKPVSRRPHSVAATITFGGVAKGESIYGLGEHKNNRVEQGSGSGYHKVFADSLYYGKSSGGDVSIPWYMSSKGYGFVWNLPSLGAVTLNQQKIEWTSASTLGVDFWITTTASDHSHRASDGHKKPSTYAQLLHNYVDAVGHATPMPFWSTGFIQCKDRYRNQTQLMDVARGYVTRELPISMIVIDWFHWVEMGDFGLNPVCWPDPKAMVDELRELGIELMVTVWPFMGLPYANGTAVSTHWDEFSSQGFLANSTATGKPETFWQYSTPTGNALIDATNPLTMESVIKHWNEGIGNYGVKAVWMDESEPDHHAYISGGQWDLHAGTDTEVLPAWVSYWSKGFGDNFKAKHGDDFFILSRNAWAGTWSNGAALWSGDIGSSFNDLKTALAAGQQAALSGVPLWTTDIGGYHGGNPADPVFQRMIVRWFQFGAMCPIFRLHGHRGGGPPSNQCGPTNGDNEVWNLAKDPEHYAAIEAVMRLRENLRDYVQRINNESVATGAPMMRPMAFEFPDDAVCANNSAEAQFMLGPSWLVSPVVADAAATWPAYLPVIQGADWVYWWNQTVVEPGWVSINTASLRDFPLFYRRPHGTPPAVV